VVKNVQLPNITPFLKLIWNDEMDVYGTHDEIHRGQAISVYDETPKFSGIQCQISFGTSNLDKPDDGDDFREPILNTATIFCDKDWDVKPDDKLKIRRFDNGEIYEEYSGIVLKIGLPNKRFSHQEIQVQLGGDA
jgi:hypothetical protein